MHGQSGAARSLWDEEVRMVVHIIPTLLGIVAPLSALGWLLSRGI
jgi:hypothetical protein